MADPPTGADSPGTGASGRRSRRALVWGLFTAIAIAVVIAVLLRRQNRGAAREDPESLRAQAVDYRNAGMLAEAEPLVERWRALRPDDIEAHLMLIDVGVRLKRLPQAIDGARAVLRLKPEAHDLRRQLAEWLYAVGRTEEADADCRRCREVRPRDPSLSFLQANICLRLGDFERAQPLLDDLLRADPDSGPALMLRGGLYVETGQPEKAIPLLREALKKGGDGHVRARHYLSQALVRVGQSDEAKEVLAELQRQQTVEIWEKYGRLDTVAYRLSMAEALLGTRQTAEALRLLEQVIQESPKCTAAHRLLAQHFEAQGELAKATEHRRKAGD
jgi:predicted Zn-dependent protease